VKPVNYISSSIFVAKTQAMGRGVFASADIAADTIIEIAPVIVLSEKDRKLIDQTLLHDYIFEWSDSRKQCCMALGYVPLYNHSYKSNCEYEMNFRKRIISVKTVRPVKKGEELYINYNGDWDNGRPLWFKAHSTSEPPAEDGNGNNV
jgi:uncharacterized protein